MTPDRDQERAKRRLETSCGEPAGPFTPGAAPLRPRVNCEPAGTEEELSFVDPEGCPPIAPLPDLVPEPLRLVSAAVTVTCADYAELGPVGIDVTVPAEEFEELVHFQALTDITQAQLSFIARMSPSLRDLALDPDIEAAELQAIFLLEGAQAALLKTRVTAARDRVDAQAVALARGQLLCYWESVAVVANCPPGALLTADAPAGREGAVNHPVTLAAGLYTSQVSQLNADAQASAAATAALRCLWANTAQTAICSELGFEEPIPVDEEPVGAANRRRIGSATVAAGSLFSDLSQADANALAKQAALGLLECFYINAAQIANCPPDEDNVPAVEEPAEGELGEQGNPVTVTAGAVESLVSTEDANIAARALAEQSLNCYWTNDEQTAECPTITDEDGDIVPSPSSPIRTVVIPAGEVVSYVSKAAANEEALLRATLQLDCRYCNRVVPPRCIPNDFTVTTLPIPLTEVTAAWSLDATLGAPAGMICLPDWQEAQNIANAVANTPIPPANPPLDCNYGNVPVEASCAGRPTDGVLIIQPVANPRARGGPCVGGADGTINAPYVLPYFLPATGTLKISLFDEDLYRSQLSSQSHPNPFAPDPVARKITIARNTFVITEGLVPPGYAPGVSNRAQLYANELAASMALSTLDCFFANCAGQYLCHGTINSNVYDPPITGTLGDIPVYGTGAALPTVGPAVPHVVAPASYGSTARPIFVPEGAFVSYVSPSEVTTALNAFLRGQLNCFWENAAATVLCGSSMTTGEDATFSYVVGTGVIADNVVHPASTGHPMKPVKVAARLFTSKVHPNMPTIQALQLALGQLDCFFLNEKVTATCPGAEDNIPAPGSTPTAVIPAGMYPSNFSQLNANALAASAAKGLLNCLWSSEPVTASGCPPGQISSGPTSLPAGFTISSVSTPDATANAQALINGLRNCQGPGEPGNDGAQASCAGNCFGFFS